MFARGGNVREQAPTARVRAAPASHAAHERRPCSPHLEGRRSRRATSSRPTARPSRRVRFAVFWDCLGSSTKRGVASGGRRSGRPGSSTPHRTSSGYQDSTAGLGVPSPQILDAPRIGRDPQAGKPRKVVPLHSGKLASEHGSWCCCSLVSARWTTCTRFQASREVPVLWARQGR